MDRLGAEWVEGLASAATLVQTGGTCARVFFFIIIILFTLSAAHGPERHHGTRDPQMTFLSFIFLIRQRLYYSGGGGGGRFVCTLIEVKNEVCFF